MVADAPGEPQPSKDTMGVATPIATPRWRTWSMTHEVRAALTPVDGHTPCPVNASTIDAISGCCM
jgi:hypothetical protein